MTDATTITLRRIGELTDACLRGEAKFPTMHDVIRIYCEEVSREVVQRILSEHPEFLA